MPTTLPQIVTGDGWYGSITLELDGVAFDASGATIKSNLVTDDDTRTVLAGPVTFNEAAPGADWANGIVVTNYGAGDLPGSITPQVCLCEIEVVKAGLTRTWFVTAFIVKGTVS